MMSASLSGPRSTDRGNAKRGHLLHLDEPADDTYRWTTWSRERSDVEQAGRLISDSITAGSAQSRGSPRARSCRRVDANALQKPKRLFGVPATRQGEVILSLRH